MRVPYPMSNGSTLRSGPMSSILSEGAGMGVLWKTGPTRSERFSLTTAVKYDSFLCRFHWGFTPERAGVVEGEGRMNTVKDLVCGMMVPVGEGLSVVYQGREFRFCSDLCKRTFLATPERYTTGETGLAPGATDVVRRIAYFSMEVAADEGMPTYSGGLGVLAGDMLRSCADLKIPIVAVSILYAHGYFEQHVDEWGIQHEQPVQ